MFARTALAAALTATLALLGACGGDDEKPSDAATKASDKPNTKTEQRTDCEAEVEVTGGVKKAWTGAAFVITENRSGPVLYRTEKGKLQLTVLSADGDFPALAQLRAGKASYTSGDKGVEAADDGSGAEVDADLIASGGGKPAHLTATITC